MTAFATQSNIQMTGAGLLGRSTASAGKSSRVTIGSGLTLSGGVLSNSLDLSGYLPLSGGTLTGVLTVPTGYTVGGTLKWGSDVGISGRSGIMDFWVAGNSKAALDGAGLSIYGGLSVSGPVTGTGGLIEQRNGLNSQCYDLFETYTSDTNNGKLRFKATSSGHQIGSARATSGSNRAVHIGHFNSSDVFSSAMSVGTDGIVTLTANMTLDPSGLVTARSVQMGLIATTATATRGILNGAATKVYLGGSTSNDTIIGALSRADITIAGATGVATFGSAIVPATLTDAAAPNGAIYYSSTQSKLVYKDSGGTVNVLY